MTDTSGQDSMRLLPPLVSSIVETYLKAALRSEFRQFKVASILGGKTAATAAVHKRLCEQAQVISLTTAESFDSAYQRLFDAWLRAHVEEKCKDGGADGV